MGKFALPAAPQSGNAIVLLTVNEEKFARLARKHSKYVYGRTVTRWEEGFLAYKLEDEFFAPRWFSRENIENYLSVNDFRRAWWYMGRWYKSNNFVQKIVKHTTVEEDRIPSFFLNVLLLHCSTTVETTPLGAGVIANAQIARLACEKAKENATATFTDIGIKVSLFELTYERLMQYFENLSKQGLASTFIAHSPGWRTAMEVLQTLQDLVKAMEIDAQKELATRALREQEFFAQEHESLLAFTRQEIADKAG